MDSATRKRPKRLWVAAIINTLVGLMALSLFAFLVMSTRVPHAFHPRGATAFFAVCAPSFLIIASIMALFGKPYGRYLMLLAALVFYATLIVQNVLLFGAAQSLFGQAGGAKVVANVARASLELLINLWALLSFKTRQYFGGAAVAP